MVGRPEDKTRDFEQALREGDNRQYELRLYVTGMTKRSTEAIKSIKALCEEELKNRYELQIIDLTKHPELAQVADIIAAPTLIKQLPLPLRRLIGHLSDRERVLRALDLRPKIGEFLSRRDGMSIDSP